MELHHIKMLPYGKFRRDLLLQYLKTDDHMIPINRSHQLNLKYDTDLKYLYKRGIVKIYRPFGNYRKKSSSSRQSYLVIT